MRKLVYLASVRSDLVAIFDHIARESGSIAMAAGFTAQLREKCRELASLPGTLGRGRAELRADIRSIAHKGYVIFFRYDQNRLEVVDIIEGHRDIDTLLGEPLS